MGVKRMVRTIFSSPLILVGFFKRSKVDNFVGGLLIGSLFTLIVNFLTIQVQETIQMQRVLEAIESEIASNLIVANNVVNFGVQDLNNPRLEPNYYRLVQRYSDKVWSNSEALKYILQLDPDIQAKLNIYFNYVVPSNNQFVDKSFELARMTLPQSCFDSLSKLDDSAKKVCSSSYRFQIDSEVGWALNIAKNSSDLLNEFHPTKDRLNNTVLKLIMGGKSLGILGKSRENISNK